MIFLHQDGAWKAWLTIPRPPAASAPATKETTPPIASANPKGPAKLISLADAAKHVNDKCTLEFEVNSTGKSGGMVFLNSKANFRDEKNFTVVLTEAATEQLKKDKVEDAPAHFKGKTVRVTGVVSLYREKPQIRIDDPSQVQLVEKKKP
jgi:DNA/RNA endonuclease YhcR with UshA esterase domain